MDYVITFSDVMAGVIALGGSVLVFFIRSWFNKLSENTEEIKKQIKENDEKVNKRIDKLEDETDGEIANIKQELNNIKGDFATTFVLREADRLAVAHKSVQGQSEAGYEKKGGYRLPRA